MDIKNLILNKVHKDGRVTAQEMVKKTGFSRAYLHRFFKELRDEGKIVLIGRANQAHYIPAHPAAIRKARKAINQIYLKLKNARLEEDRVLEQIKNSSGIFIELPENIVRILRYSFTEMLNNAIEHSGSREIEIKMERLPGSVHFSVNDQGVGIFKKIMDQKGLASPFEAIQELLKGKQTTAPEAHSGEGIFFTSKVADRLVIKSGRKKLIFDNLLEDVIVDECSRLQGTKVLFAIALETKRKLEDVFKDFSNEAFEFNKTQVHVRLFRMGRDYVSRSQARRILSGLESFETVIVDFSGITAIGQAFADEIFRVWKNRFPEKNIIVQKTNENIDFMIKRARQ